MNEAHCIEMLSSFSNKTQICHTAHVVCFNTTPPLRYAWVSSAELTMTELSHECLVAFSKIPEPYIHSGGF